MVSKVLKYLEHYILHQGLMQFAFNNFERASQNNWIHCCVTSTASVPGHRTKRNTMAHSEFSCELMTQVVLILSKPIITSRKATVEVS